METPFHSDPLEFKLELAGDGSRIAKNPLTSLVILPDGESRLFKRRAIKKCEGKETKFDSILIGELDGVRVYVRDNQIIMTKQDLYI